MELLSRDWKTIEGKTIGDLKQIVADAMSDGRKQIHIGTDSQQNKKHTHYVTVLVVLTEGKGGRAFYCRERVPRIKSLRERLLKEVWMSVSLGMELNGVIPEASELTVHVDANPNTKFKSSAYVKELTSLVVSQGFKAILKPESWCASHAADHVVKHHIAGA